MSTKIIYIGVQVDKIGVSADVGGRKVSHVTLENSPVGGERTRSQRTADLQPDMHGKCFINFISTYDECPDWNVPSVILFYQNAPWYLQLQAGIF